jgi:NADH dehydrogenase FAD-containing subunit
MEAKDNVYVIGDNASMPFSGLAQTAIRDADYVAGDVVRALKGSPRPPYHQKAPISVIPVGENWAVAEYKGRYVYGFVGFILRRIADLIGYADIERWPQAVKVWLQDGRTEDGCPVCAQDQSTVTQPSRNLPSV